MCKPHAEDCRLAGAPACKLIRHEDPSTFRVTALEDREEEIREAEDTGYCHAKVYQLSLPWHNSDAQEE